MTEMVNKWTEEEFCREFWASVDEFYGRWKESSGGRLPDCEAAIARGKRDGIPPHPAYQPHPGEVIRDGDVEKAPEKGE